MTLKESNIKPGDIVKYYCYRDKNGDSIALYLVLSVNYGPRRSYRMLRLTDFYIDNYSGVYECEVILRLNDVL